MLVFYSPFHQGFQSEVIETRRSLQYYNSPSFHTSVWRSIFNSPRTSLRILSIAIFVLHRYCPISTHALASLTSRALIFLRFNLFLCRFRRIYTSGCIILQNQLLKTNYADLNMSDKSLSIGMLSSVPRKNICSMHFADSTRNAGSMRSNRPKRTCWFGYVWRSYSPSMLCAWSWSCSTWLGALSPLISVTARMKKISFNDFIAINYFLFHYFFHSPHWASRFVCLSKEYGLKPGVTLNSWSDRAE